MAVGGGLAVFAGSWEWDTVVVTRAAPLAGFSVAVAGRTIEPAVTGLGVVALAGVVAVLASRGPLRRIVGAVVAVAGVVLGWRAVAGFSAVSIGYARDLVVQSRTGTALDAGAGVRVDVHPLAPAVAVVAAALVVAGGALVVARAGRWTAMGARYDAPAGGAGGPAAEAAASGGAADHPADDAGSTAGAGDLALWKSLDRGDDPTL